jgi:hypothetical protein
MPSVPPVPMDKPTIRIFCNNPVKRRIIVVIFYITAPLAKFPKISTWKIQMVHVHDNHLIQICYRVFHKHCIYKPLLNILLLKAYLYICMSNVDSTQK